MRKFRDEKLKKILKQNDKVDVEILRPTKGYTLWSMIVARYCDPSTPAAASTMRTAHVLQALAAQFSWAQGILQL